MLLEFIKAKDICVVPPELLGATNIVDSVSETRRDQDSLVKRSHDHCSQPMHIQTIQYLTSPYFPPLIPKLIFFMCSENELHRIGGFEESKVVPGVNQEDATKSVQQYKIR